MSSGDPLIDDPESRQVMEQSFKLAAPGEDGLLEEIGGSCTASLECETRIGGSQSVGVPIVDGAAFEFHSHPLEGLQTNNRGETVIFSMPNVPSNEDKNGVIAGLPMYVIAKNFIYRVTLNPKGGADVATFNRWR